MPNRIAGADSFLAWYSLAMPAREDAAREVREWLAVRMKDLGVSIDSVGSRAKDPKSVKGKLRSKKYSRPKLQMTDTVGARVVLLFDSDVEPVTRYLRSALEVNEKHSRDGGDELELAEFGYRSVHLIVRFRGRTMPRYTEIGRPWVEIQVRSILQHAWAAIGHDHLYKGALKFPDILKRRFYAIAGGLELYDKEFDSILAYRNVSHQRWMEAFSAGQRMQEPLDIAAVSAMFEVLFPGSQWSALSRGGPLSPAVEVALMTCLRTAGIHTARDLRRLALRRRFRRRLETYAAAVGTSAGDVSNFAKSVLAIGELRSELLLRQYDELIDDARLRQAILLQ